MTSDPYKRDTIENAWRNQRLLTLYDHVDAAWHSAVEVMQINGENVILHLNTSPVREITRAMSDLSSVENDTDSEAGRRERRKREEAEAVAAAYKVVSRSLNVMGTGTEGPLLEALRSEHSTLLGKLANTVLTAVNERQGDGRLEVLNMPLSDIIVKTGWGGNAPLSEIRQPTI